VFKGGRIGDQLVGAQGKEFIDAFLPRHLEPTRKQAA
jgi:hypothetical protein